MCVFTENTEAVPLLALHKTELHVALENGRYEAASELIKSESEEFLMKCYENYEGYSPPSYKSNLHIIAGLPDKEQAVRLCKELLDNVKEQGNRERLLNATVVEQVSYSSWTVRARVAAIHIATCSGNSVIVRLLCDKYGVDVNCSTSEAFGKQPQKDMTPLHWAAAYGHVEVVKLLLDNNADVNASRTNDGTTSLYIAAYNGRTEVVKLLLDNNADVNASRTDDGTTPLYIAAQYGHTEVVNLLLDNNADVNARRTNDGDTPLYIAAYSGRTEVVKLLLDNNADVNIERHDGEKPIDAALQCRHWDIVKLLQ